MTKKTTRSYAPQFLADLLTYNTQVLMDSGLDEEAATAAAREVCRRMCGEWGGQLIYFPHWLRESLTERDQQVWEEFDGRNHSALAKKYNVSVQRIYRIVEIMRVQENDKRQGKLAI